MKSKRKAKPERLFTDEESEFFETAFGDRKVSHVNQSRMIAIPKLALENLCDSTDGLTMAISLVQKGKDKFLKLIPIGNEDADEEYEDEDDDEEDDE